MSNDAVVRALLNGILSDAKPSSPDEIRKICARDFREEILAEFTPAKLQELAVDVWQKNYEPLIEGAKEEALATLLAGDQQGSTRWASMAESSRRDRDAAIRLIKTPFCGTALFEISYALFGRSAREGRTAVAGRGSQRRLWRSRSIVDPKTGIA
ncbi:MAG TPA: hypothetical protein VGX78_12050 [Pirellulales bacterium]|nr:hypothetical protein [Pirellulales bacterium]